MLIQSAVVQHATLNRDATESVVTQMDTATDNLLKQRTLEIELPSSSIRLNFFTAMVFSFVSISFLYFLIWIFEKSIH